MSGLQKNPSPGAIVIFGVVYPWVTGMAASVDFSASGFIAYDTGHFEFRLKNLGTVATSVNDANSGDGTNTLNLANAGATIPSGEEVQIYTTFTTAPGSGVKLTITITCTFANGKKVTHQYTTYVESA